MAKNLKSTGADSSTFGSDGKTVDLFFPHHIDSGNYIAAGTHRFPRASWRINANGPVGTDRILAIVSPVKRNFEQFAAGEIGPFLLLADSSNISGARNLSLETLRPSTPPLAECGARNLSLSSNQRDCVQAYGVGLATIEEVR